MNFIKLSDDEYHARTELSSSGIKDLLICPHYYYKRNVLKTNKAPTASQLQGRAIHKALLESDLSDVKDSDLEMIQEVTESDLFRNLITGGVAEHTGFFNYMDVDFRIKPDYFIFDRELIVDVKTITTLSEQNIRSHIRTYGYDIQSALYQIGINKIFNIESEFVFLFVEKSEPYRVQTCMISAEARDNAINKIHTAINTYINCRSSNKWDKNPLLPYIYRD